MGIFDNTTKITINGKEVQSIKKGSAYIYKKPEPEPLDLTITGVYGSVSYTNLRGTNIEIEWGDGTTRTANNGRASHNYDDDGEYTVIIKGLTGIGMGAFEWTYMSGIKIPSSLQNIDIGAFDSVMNLETIDLYSNTPLPYETFDGCNPAYFIIPKGSMDDYMFADYPLDQLRERI